MCFFYVYKRDLLGELVLNYLTNITLPKSVSNSVPNGIRAQETRDSRREPQEAAERGPFPQENGMKCSGPF